MATLATLVVNTEFRDAVEVAMRELVTAAHRNEGSYVKLPLMYPSGGGVVVRVSGGPDAFFVSDFGMGFHEAEMMGADRSYARHARVISERSGVGFDEHAFFSVQVGESRIAGAIITIANCSYEAVAITALKAAERAENSVRAILVDKLEAAFGAERLVRDDEISGDSGSSWKVTASVVTGSHKTIFDASTKHVGSVYRVASAMGDIARLSKAPNRVVMVHDKAELGPHLGLLSHDASVIDEAIAIDRIRSFVKAA